MRGKALPLCFIMAILLPLGMMAAFLEKPAQAAPLLSPGQDNIVISEFRPRDSAGTTQNDFVELFNPSSGTIDISTWVIKSVSFDGVLFTIFNFPLGVTLAAGQHMLVTGGTYTGSGTAAADANFSSPNGIAPNGGVALTLPDGTIIDKVGTSAASAEGTPLSPLSGTLDESYERKPGGALGSCYDSNNNSFDFAYRSPSDPQNSLVITACAPPTSTPPISETETFTPTYTVNDTASPTKTASATQTPSGTSLYTSTPVAPNHLVISEFRSRGPNGENDEFVELFNPTGAATNIGGWTIQYSSGCGSVVAVLATIPDNTPLLAGQHYLLASSSNSSIGWADQLFTPGLTDDGGVALINPAGQIQDQVGTCISTLFHDGENLDPLQGDSNQSYERLPGGATACYDTNNNAGDFVLISPSRPQNKAFGINLCFGIKTSTPTRTASPTRTITRTRGPTGIPDLVLINEFLPRPLSDWNDDGAINEGDEFIEIVNRGARVVSLGSWALDNGTTSVSYSLPKVNLNPGQILVFFHSESGIPLPDGGGTVRLVKASGQTADIFRYGPDEVDDRTWCRLPDRNNGQLSFACQPTPGKANIPFSSTAPTPIPRNDTSVEVICNLPDTVPPAMLLPECDPFGSGIWRPLPGELWILPVESKWSVFVE